MNWHTHRQNPSVCWICDMNILISKILFYTKSTLDMETEFSSEEVSDSEIENNLNVDDEQDVDDTNSEET